jgi:hypothetical protein
VPAEYGEDGIGNIIVNLRIVVMKRMITVLIE